MVISLAPVAPEGMAEGDSAAVDVDLGVIEAGLLHPCHHNRRERFVDLDKIDIVRRQACFGASLAGWPESVPRAS